MINLVNYFSNIKMGTSILSLAEKYVLLSLGKPDLKAGTSNTGNINQGITCSLVAQLILSGLITINDYTFSINNELKSDKKYIKYFLNILNKNNSFKNYTEFLQRTTEHSKELKKLILQDLEGRNFISVKKHKRLFITTGTKLEITNEYVYKDLITRIKDIVFAQRKAFDEEIILLGIIKCTELAAKIFGNKPDTKLAKMNINEMLTKNLSEYAPSEDLCHDMYNLLLSLKANVS